MNLYFYIMYFPPLPVLVFPLHLGFAINNRLVVQTNTYLQKDSPVLTYDEVLQPMLNSFQLKVTAPKGESAYDTFQKCLDLQIQTTEKIYLDCINYNLGSILGRI